MLHREVATRLLVSWANSSSNGLLLQLLCEMIHLPTQRSNRTSTFMCRSLFSSSNLVSHQVQSPLLDLGPPDPMVISLIAQMTYSEVSTWWEQFSLSSAGHASFVVWHRWVFWQTHLPLRTSLIYCQFWSMGPTICFSTFPMVSRLPLWLCTWGFSFSRGFSQRCVISATHTSETASVSWSGFPKC